MNDKHIGLLATLILITATAQETHADTSVLLGQTEVSIGGFWSGNVPPVLKTIIGMQFYVSLGEDLFTNMSYAGGTYPRVDESQLARTLGGSLFLSKGQTGVYDFPVTNGISFSNVVAALTNGTNDFMIVGGFGYNADRIETGGGYGGNQDDTALWGLPSGSVLVGARIDFFRLIVSLVDWGSTNGGFQITGNAQWQVYGETNQTALTITPYGSNVILAWPTNATDFTLQSTTNLGSLAVWGTISPGPVVIGGENVVFCPFTGNQMFFRLSK